MLKEIKIKISLKLSNVLKILLAKNICILTRWDIFFCFRGQTALHKAAWYQRRTICYMLVEAGASLTRTDYQGNTPRLQALRAEDKELAAYLESKPTSLLHLLFNCVFVYERKREIENGTISCV